jgi:hypothetical protein
VTTLSKARLAVLSAQDDLIAGAVALDEVDAAAAAGERAAARTARAEAGKAAPAARAALTALPGRLEAYRTSLEGLTRATEATPVLDQGQRGLLAAVVRNGNAEVTAAEALRVTGNGVWPSYSRLDAATRTWVERATAGWYRSRTEGAAAYAVLADDLREPLDRARTALQRDDGTRRAAASRMSLALREADAALAPLRAPG